MTVRGLRFLLVAVALAAGAANVPAAERAVRIGILEYGTERSGGALTYLAALRALGYAEPATLAVDWRFAAGDPARFEALARELAAQRVTLLFAPGHDIAKAAKAAAPALPIVTSGSENPELSGLVASLRRPGGNVTGVTFMSPELAGKRLELLKEAVPGLARVAVVWDPDHADTYYAELLKSSGVLGVQLESLEVRTAADIAAIASRLKASRAQAMFIVPGRLTVQHGKSIADAAIGARLACMAAYAVQARQGCMVAYGADLSEMLRRAAMQTDRIARGARPGDLPIEQPTRFALVLNLKSANAIGARIPQSLLVRADEVVE